MENYVTIVNFLKNKLQRLPVNELFHSINTAFSLVRPLLVSSHVLKNLFSELLRTDIK